MSDRLKTFTFDVVMYLTNYIVATIPSRHFRRGFYRYVLNLEIGASSHIFMGARFDSRGRFRMGNNSVINEDCRLDNRGEIRIGDCVSISAGTVILTADHDIQSMDFTGRTRPVTIGNYVFVGTRATILPGVSVGDGAVVGASSVVTRDVGEFEIVAGVPAKPIGRRTRDLRYKIDYGRWLH
jgi:acetyltransferase-like isoleucine patch superfamily enzyme